MNQDEVKRRLKAGAFVENNGRVLRTINILRTGYNKLSLIKYALDDIPEGEYKDSVNYLHEEGYIHLRYTEGKRPAETGLADAQYQELEGKLTAKGIRLLAGSLGDDLVKI